MLVGCKVISFFIQIQYLIRKNHFLTEILTEPEKIFEILVDLNLKVFHGDVA